MTIPKKTFKKQKTTDEILDHLNVSKNEYEWTLSISDEDRFQIYTKLPPHSCFANSYFSEGLQAWNANIDIQPVFDHYKTVACLCAYMSKPEDECSQAMKHTVSDGM